MSLEAPRERGRTAIAQVIGALATSVLIVAAAPGTFMFTSPWPALIAWIAFAPLFVTLERADLRRAVGLGALTGFMTNLGLWLWFPGLLARFGNIHPVLAGALSLVIFAAHSLGWALWAGLVVWCRPVLPSVVVAPVLFVAIERWSPAIFPYSLGLTQYRQSTLAQAAELGGPAVLTFSLVLAGAVLAETVSAARKRRRPSLSGPLAVTFILAALLLFGRSRLDEVRAMRATAPEIRVGLIQPDPVKTGWSRPPDDAGALDRYQRTSARLEASLEEPLDLLLWPEQSYPLLLRNDSTRDYPRDQPRRIRRGFESPLLFGLTAVDPRTRQITNSAAFLDGAGALEVVYDKVHLIFFSEWLPEWLAGWVDGGLRYRAGTRFDPLIVPLAANNDDGPRQVAVGVFICFESSFPAHLRRLMRGQPQLLVNLTDDSWFGPTAEPEQHLSQAVFRAIESRRDLIRATTSGMSAHIAATGEILSRTTLNEAETPLGVVTRPRILDIDSFFEPLGNGFPIACAGLSLLCVVLAFWLRRKEERRL